MTEMAVEELQYIVDDLDRLRTEVERLQARELELLALLEGPK